MNKITQGLISAITAAGAILGVGDRVALARSDFYFIKARHSGQCLNVFNYGQRNGDNVVQGEDCDNTNFQWSIIPANSKYYYIKARHSGQCLNVLNSGRRNGDNVVQGENCDTSNFQWSIDPVGNGLYYIRARHSGQCLNVLNSGKKNGDNVVQGDQCNSTNFQWAINPTYNRPTGSSFERNRSRHQNRDFERRNQDFNNNREEDGGQIKKQIRILQESR
ncbi:MAG: RICIN domain-containing protein [Cyanobacteria bacterium P01_G01_bin.19]